MKKKPKILCIIQLPPPIHGVTIINSYIYNSKILNDLYDIQAISLSYAKTTGELGSISCKKIFIFIQHLVKILKTLFFFRPQMVYFTITPYGPSFYRDVFIVSLIKLFQTKLVYHLHGKGIKNHYKKNKILYNYIYKNVNVICLSKFLLNDIDFYKKTPYIVNNGIPEISVDQYKGKGQYQKRNEVVKILYLSNFAETKGVIDLLESVSLLQEKDLHFKIQLIGQYRGIFTKEFLSDYIKDNYLQDYVELLGPLYGNDKNYYLAKTDIFVHPTYNDAFPTVLLEAMQFGLPCISTYEGGIPEIIEDNITGFLFQQRNINELAEKIEFLIKNEKLRISFGKNGRKRYEECFSLAIFEKNMSKTFNDILRIT